MLISLPLAWIIVLNVLAWLAIHLGVAWAITQLPAARFDCTRWLYRPRRWERDGRLYEQRFAIRTWKARLPDGAARFQAGFRKRTLQSADRGYLERFARETCRSELVHWLVLSAAWFFFTWNPPWAGGVMLLYAAGVNLPCILAQRYNRLRLVRVLANARKLTPAGPAE